MKLKSIWCVFLVVSGGITFGQDPTIPSKDIAERLKLHEQAVPFEAPKPMPKFKLRAIVLLDSDHGTAIVEVEDRKFRIPLDRVAIGRRKELNEPAAASLIDAIQVQGSKFFVEGFSAQTIALTDGKTTVLVQ